jgi:hypothetical protein
VLIADGLHDADDALQDEEGRARRLEVGKRRDSGPSGYTVHGSDAASPVRWFFLLRPETQRAALAALRLRGKRAGSHVCLTSPPCAFHLGIGSQLDAGRQDDDLFFFARARCAAKKGLESAS